MNGGRAVSYFVYLWFNLVQCLDSNQLLPRTQSNAAGKVQRSISVIMQVEGWREIALFTSTSRLSSVLRIRQRIQKIQVKIRWSQPQIGLERHVSYIPMAWGSQGQPATNTLVRVFRLHKILSKWKNAVAPTSRISALQKCSHYATWPIMVG